MSGATGEQVQVHFEHLRPLLLGALSWSRVPPPTQAPPIRATPPDQDEACLAGDQPGNPLVPAIL
jgi:hypothetical protein